jgi:hypothetical protein
MFFEKSRLDLFRQMILSATAEERCACLTKMLPLQQDSFRDILRIMPGRSGLPIHDSVGGMLYLKR